MKKRFGVEQKIRILREAEGGISGSEIAPIIRPGFKHFVRFQPIEYFASLRCSGVQVCGLNCGNKSAFLGCSE